jgi:hypothetical protein
VFTARYALSPYIKQIRFVFKGLTLCVCSARVDSRVVGTKECFVTNFKPMFYTSLFRLFIRCFSDVVQ